MSEVRFKLAAGTNVGLIRTNNEDNFVVCPDLSTSQWLIPQDGDYAVLGELGALLVVADGMGGANAGEVASAIAVETIQQLFVPDKIRGVVNDEAAIQNFMKDVVKSADLNILQRSKQDESAKGMGTTVVMAWIIGQRAYVCWCGDSRCYSFNYNRGLLQISKDHSYVQELVDQGELEPEFMHDHPLSNVITRCLGDMEKRANPDTKVYELSNGDSIMLCSDGLSGLCYDDQITEIIDKFGENPMDCKNELISAALNNGGHDNVTVAMITVKTDDDAEQTVRPAAPRTKEEKEEADTLKDTVKSYPKIKKRPVQEKIEEKPVVVETPAVVEPVVEEPVAEPVVETPVVAEPVVEEPVAEPVKAEPVKPEPVAKKPAEKEKPVEDKEATEEAPAKEDTKEQETEEKKDNPDGNATDDPKSTAKPAAPVKVKGTSWTVWLVVVIVFLLIVACCIYFIPAFAPVREAISQMIGGQSANPQ